jgi:bifunctional DNA-binding transcriptional regulator/antitoxin component of YhaV-PrlF toxin-antitoxin module
MDSAGRLIIPAKLRQLLNMRPGDLFQFYTTTLNGRKFLCIPCGGQDLEEEKELEWAMQILSDHGVDI